MIKLIMLLGMVATTGCMTPFGLSGSAAQLKELVKVKDSTLSCAKGVYAGITLTVVNVSVDKGIYGNATIDENCKATVTTERPAPTVRSPAP